MDRLKKSVYSELFIYQLINMFILFVSGKIIKYTYFWRGIGIVQDLYVLI